MKYEINLNNKKYIIEVANTKAIILEKTNSVVSSSMDEDYIDVPDFDFSEGNKNFESNVSAPLLGTVIAINVHNGDEVKEGDIILVIESMKMENEILSPINGIIGDILVEVGTTVKKNQLLVNIVDNAY